MICKHSKHFKEDYPKGRDAIHIDNFPIKAFPVSVEVHGCVFGDTDGDGSVTVIDATFIQKFSASLPCPPGDRRADHISDHSV